MAAKTKKFSVTDLSLGMNNQRADYMLFDKESGNYFMRDILNCDMTEGGSLKRRQGYTLGMAGTNVGSLWADEFNAYFSDNAALYRLTCTGKVLSKALVTGATVVAGNPVAYATAPQGGTFWTDGVTQNYAVGTTSTPLAPPQPVAVPSATQIAGTLEAGIYSFAFTYTFADGREGPATAPVTITVPANSGISFNLAGSPPAGHTLNAYVSMPNGVEMYKAVSWTGAGTQNVTSTSALGAPCMTVGLQNLPAGRLMQFNLGRLWVASGSTLYYSLPWAPGLYDPTNGYIPLPQTITVLCVINGEGLYAVSDATYWLAGDPEAGSARLEPVAPVQGLLGSGFDRPDMNECGWMSPRGIVIGRAGGKIAQVQAENVAVNPKAKGVSFLWNRGGVTEIVTSMSGADLATQSQLRPYTSDEVLDTTGEGETWVANTVTSASRHYLNYQFLGFAEINGLSFGAKANGVYLLEGDTDAGTPITALVNPGRQRFGSFRRSRLDTAYLSVASPEVMALTVTNDAGESYTFNTRRSAPTLQQQRFDLGRGLTGTYLSFVISNVNGSDFELDGFEFMVSETTRRIAA